MQFDFWQSLWDQNDLGFHQSEVNPGLRTHVDALQLSNGSRVMVPLAGKSVDILYLRDQGFHVVAIEFVEQAVRDFFAEHKILFEEFPLPRGGIRFEAEGITFFQSDLFELEASDVGPIDAAFDRAALVALPAAQRRRYAKKLRELMPDAHRRLLINFTYPQEQMEGPPFSVAAQEVHELFAEAELQVLESEDLVDKSPFRDRLSSFEVSTWLMTFS